MRKFAGLALALLMSPVWADGFSLGFGQGLDEKLIQSGSISNASARSMGLFRELDWHPHLPWFPADASRLELHHARLLGHLKGRSQSLSLTALTPVWRWQLGESRGWALDAGIGLAHLSDERFLKVRTKGQTQFNMQAGLVWTAETDWELSLRYRHYSSGYVQRPNPGLDFAELGLAWSF